MDTNENKTTAENQLESDAKSNLFSVNATEASGIEGDNKADFLADIFSKATSIPEINKEDLQKLSEDEIVTSEATYDIDKNMLPKEDTVEAYSAPEPEIQEPVAEENVSEQSKAEEISGEPLEEILEAEPEAEEIVTEEYAVEENAVEENAENIGEDHNEENVSNTDIKTETASSQNKKAQSPSSKSASKKKSSKKKNNVKPRSLVMEYVYHWYVIIISLMMCVPAFLLEILLGNLLLAKDVSPFFASLMTMFIGGFIATLPLLILNIVLVVRKKYYAIAVQLISMQLIGMVFYVYSKISLGIG